MNMIRVLVVDDHAVVRAGLVAVLHLEADIRVVAQARTGEEAVQLYRDMRPDVVTMDLRMPGNGGSSAIASLRAEFPNAKVLVLTTLSGDEHVYRALEAGALGFLLKDSDDGELAAAIRTTHAGKRTIPADVAAILAGRIGFEPLSAREVEVLRKVAKGRSNKEIGENLHISENTVKSYLKTIALKLDAPDRTAAVMIAVKRGLFHIDED